MENKRATNNRTITLTEAQTVLLKQQLSKQDLSLLTTNPSGIWKGRFEDYVLSVKEKSIDMLFLDPPYNLTKNFNGSKFFKTTTQNYTKYLHNILTLLTPLLKPTSTIYICGDWLTSHSIFEVASKFFIVRNRITWEREKGRGAKTNWKNSSEDIWFCTKSSDYCFNVNKVKLRRKVLAPYTNRQGQPKDYHKTKKGNFRDTYPSNLWTDISIPFWSMPENTDHPTQKSEKLLAKLILASSNEGDLIMDPFLGSGTTAVVSKKLNRRYLGFELNEEYILTGLHRLNLASINSKIQGYSNNIFWERNSQPPAC